MIRTIVPCVVGMGSALAFFSADAPAAHAQPLPTGFVRTNLITGGPISATAMVRRPDGSILIAMKEGPVRVYRNGALLTTPFYTFPSVVTSGEAGVIGITIDPNYAINGYVYARVSRPTGGGIMRLTGAADVATTNSETQIFDIPDSGGFHRGGAVHFASDGTLYFTVGDNFSSSNAPLLTNLLGKIMRINADGSIPIDNPFYSVATGDNRAIWARGLRNPFTFAFQPGTSRLHINNVGDAWEEINVGIPGADYGWPSTEGTFDPVAHPTFTQPLYTYPTPGGHAITGGAFYNPVSPRFPAFYRGAYFFGDVVSGKLRTVDPATGVATDFGTGFTSVVDLDVTPDGRLLVLMRAATTIASVDYTLGACCTAGSCTTTTSAACASDFRGVGSSCSPATCCMANFDHDDSISVLDIFAYLSAWFAGQPAAEFNGVPGLSIDDIFAFLAAWFAGCA